MYRLCCFVTRKANSNQMQKRLVTTSLSSKHQSYDVIIIGGGPIGVSTALHLAQSTQAKVLVVEKSLEYNNSSAMLSCGGIRQQFSLPENVNMTIYGADFIRNIAHHCTVDNSPEEKPDVHFRENGYLFLGGDEHRGI